jgi:hypothetical protein
MASESPRHRVVAVEVAEPLCPPVPPRFPRLTDKAGRLRT